MLARGAQKFGGPTQKTSNDDKQSAAKPYAIAIEADALHLPLRAESLDLVVTAFGFRNLANYAAGLKEFYRTLKPGGQLGILEFSEPGGLTGKAYALYFRRILPAIGRLICGKDGPYNYLPNSVGAFPAPGGVPRDAAARGLCGLCLAALHLRHCGVVHGHTATGNLEIPCPPPSPVRGSLSLPFRASLKRSGARRGSPWQLRRS